MASNPTGIAWQTEMNRKGFKKLLPLLFLVVKELLDQVYQFSRMYWKSISQQNMPVTIKYPEMVAEIYPYFEHDKLPDFGKKNLWFL